MFIPHHVLVPAERNPGPAGSSEDASTPARWMLILHGIYGSGANWRTFARKLTGRRPDWGMVLVDLRMHGRSVSAPPPHTVAAAAADLVELSARLAGEGIEVQAVCGHSFGGKVALEYRARAGSELVQTWVLDSSPSARPGALDEPDNLVARVLAMLSELPDSFASREEFIGRAKEHGFPTALGQWLAMNLERRGDGYGSRLDPGAMGDLLRDYYALDSWPALSTGSSEVRAVLAGKSSALSAEERELFDAAAMRATHLHVSRIEGSGHWIHIEAPAALLDIMAAGLPSSPGG